jgi:hypothetical protein
MIGNVFMYGLGFEMCGVSGFEQVIAKAMGFQIGGDGLNHPFAIEHLDAVTVARQGKDSALTVPIASAEFIQQRVCDHYE